MNHEHYETLLPLYAAGQLSGTDRTEIEMHLAGCAECQADLQLWQALAGEIKTSSRSLSAPPQLAERALEQIHAPGRLALAFLRTGQLLRAQTFLVQREMWPAAAAVMALGLIVALISNHVEFVYFISPLVAAAAMAMLSGEDNDPAYELTVATPTSPWKVLLARMSIVSAYNLLLTLGALLVLLIFAPPGLLGTLALGWLAPMAFLSTLALLLSLWVGTGNAIVISYALWVIQYIPLQSLGPWMISSGWTPYQQFWQNSPLLLLLSVLMLVFALFSANHPVFRLSQGRG